MTVCTHVAARRLSLLLIVGASLTGKAQSPPPASVPDPATPAPIVEAAPILEEAIPAKPADPFKNVPVVQPLSRAGAFQNPPTGPGAYSLLEALQGKETSGPPKYPYLRYGLMPQSFFDMDWQYLDDPNNTEHDFFDPLKRMRIGDNWMFTTGGSIWNRSMYEHNSRLTKFSNDYDLTRLRVYGDWWYRDTFRFYAEYIGAFVSGQDLIPLPIDDNRNEILNLFIDLKLFEFNGKPAYLRVGRQELLFGSQRLISTLEWANTRRTFQGVRLTHQGETVSADVFWVKPVPVISTKLDNWDQNQDFAGVWTTMHPTKTQAIDVYYLYLNNRNALTQQGIIRQPSVTNTMGSRYMGAENNFLWDFEGAMQLGSVADQNLIAGMATAGLGYHFKDLPWNPTFWAYYDYASGDPSPNHGTAHTFYQLFPFGHYYFGWADQVGRQNIQDFNLHLYTYPTKWLTLWLQYHHFWLAASQDALYNPPGNAIRRDPSGKAGRDVGQEVDFVANFHLSRHADIITGYSYLFGGEFLQKTAKSLGAVDNSMYFLQFNYRW